MKTLMAAMMAAVIVGPFQLDFGAKGSMSAAPYGALRGRSELAFVRELLPRTLNLKLAVARELDTARPAAQRYDTLASATLAYRFGN